MRKTGGFSLVCYFIYLLFGIGGSVYCYLGTQNAKDWDGLGYAILLMFILIFSGVALVSLILKLLDMATGFGLFGFLCGVIDLGVACTIGYLFIDGQAELSVVTVIVGVIAIMSLISMISNFASMAR